MRSINQCNHQIQQRQTLRLDRKTQFACPKTNASSACKTIRLSCADNQCCHTGRSVDRQPLHLICWNVSGTLSVQHNLHLTAGVLLFLRALIATIIFRNWHPFRLWCLYCFDQHRHTCFCQWLLFERHVINLLLLFSIHRHLKYGKIGKNTNVYR